MSSPTKLRRIALDQQGLLKNNSFGRGKKAVLRAIEHLGYVQIDTISVVERAHHHVLWSRVSNYRAAMLDALVAEREVFEYWFHAAAWLPMRDFRFALPRMQTMHGDRNWFPDSNKKLMKGILHRISKEGPLRARDFEDTRDAKGEWWDWKPAKQAMEQLFMQGELMVTAREGFQKVYDLPERVIPDGIDTRCPDTHEFAAYLIDTAIRAHGLASLKSFTYLRKGSGVRNAVKEIILDRVAAGELQRLYAKDGREYFVTPELLERRAPAAKKTVRILSPFDNCVIQRERGRSLFDFDYQIECYVPEKKRAFGYFCLPLLYGDRLVGRMDCKAHRNNAELRVRQLHIESDVDQNFETALRLALVQFARFNHCTQVTFDAHCAARGLCEALEIP